MTLVTVVVALVVGAAGSFTQPPDLVAAVEAAIPARAGSGSPGSQVTMLRESRDGWAFGTAVRRAPAAPDTYPDGWLWVARAEPGRWRVALEGGPGFRELAARAPVLAVAERATLTELAGRPAGASDSEAGDPEATDYRTGMRLPYAVGQAWRYTGGPHPMNGAARSSIDLAGGDGRVRAARAGTAYTMCGSGTGWLRVVHDRGFATDYYHLEDAIAADGRPVAAGDALGRIGTDVSCGGSATGPHVHFSLRRGGDYVPIDRYGFGKWSVRAGDQPYQGFARHGSTRVRVGGSLHNYGALGFTEGVVDTDGGGALNRRAGSGTGHRVVGTVADGATVRVTCSARGTTHTGRDGYTSDLWNRLAGGGWVSDAFLWTGTGNPVAGWCQPPG
ncbi:MAG: peptidoglycan DD-metalloendopeptidase family protein [Micromonosporaceae bacterium]|nr:peptidoglycan DD-metalloendopeptidase family protein [Micromonosporaceae bacterium]